jgi:hypothetical protein
MAAATLKMEAIRSSETLFHTRSTRRHIPEDGILHSHHRENIKSYILLCCFSPVNTILNINTVLSNKRRIFYLKLNFALAKQAFKNFTGSGDKPD